MAGKTKYEKFRGKIMWAQVYDPDTKFGARWKACLILDEDTEKKVKSSGIQKKVNDTPDGRMIEFTRECAKLIKGVLHEFHPPVILDKDGSILVGYQKNASGDAFDRVGDVVLIGNGSDVEITVAVYDTQKGKGQRLESIKVLDLIEYIPTGGVNAGTIVKGETKATVAKTPWDE